MGRLAFAKDDEVASHHPLQINHIEPLAEFEADFLESDNFAEPQALMKREARRLIGTDACDDAVEVEFRRYVEESEHQRLADSPAMMVVVNVDRAFNGLCVRATLIPGG